MLEPEEVSAILRLNELGWGAKRIARELGISRNTAKDYIAAGGWMPYRQLQRKKALDGHEAWLREGLRRHRGNADVIRQELAAEKGIIVSLRTAERAVQRYRQELAAEARATVRFETPPGKQLQIDFGERLVELGDPSRNIPPCASCHRPGSGGPIETPILSEQGNEYIVLQLKMYATGDRRNDVYGRMRAIAAKLTPAEIDGLAVYYRAGFR
jgi:cytochrome c553